jgi:hypothetical protein
MVYVVAGNAAAVNPKFAEAYRTLPQHILKRMGEITQDLEQEVIAGNEGGKPPGGQRRD